MVDVPGGEVGQREQPACDRETRGGHTPARLLEVAALRIRNVAVVAGIQGLVEDPSPVRGVPLARRRRGVRGRRDEGEGALLPSSVQTQAGSFGCEVTWDSVPISWRLEALGPR